MSVSTYGHNDPLPDDELARLRVRVAELEAENRKLYFFLERVANNAPMANNPMSSVDLIVRAPAIIHSFWFIGDWARHLLAQNKDDQ